MFNVQLYDSYIHTLSDVNLIYNILLHIHSCSTTTQKASQYDSTCTSCETFAPKGPHKDSSR